MQELFKAVRASSGPDIWSKGVGITRSGKVFQEYKGDDEIRVRVSVPGKPVTLLVTLWPEDEDWSCDCKGDEDPCEHVAASVIALKKSLDAGEDLPSAQEDAASIHYHFTRKEGMISFNRVVLNQNRTEPLHVVLTAITSGRIRGPKIHPDRQDMTVDRLIDGVRQGGIYPAEKLRQLIIGLAGSDRVWLDGQPVQCSQEPTGTLARISDRSGGVWLEGGQPQNIDDMFKNGVVLSQNTLHPVCQPRLKSETLNMLVHGQFFGNRDIPWLVSEIIPEIQAQMPLHIEAKNIPGTVRVLPHILWETSHSKTRLQLKPLIAYGSPTLAVIRNDRLEASHGSKEVPVRLPLEERKLRDQLKRDHGLSDHEFKELSGSNGVRLLEELIQQGSQVTGPGKNFFVKKAPLNAKIIPDPGNPMAFSAEFSGGENSGSFADPMVVLEAWKQGESMVPLLDESGWAEIPVNWLDQFGSKVLDLISAKNEQNELPPCLVPALATLCQDLNLKVSPDLSRWQIMAENFDKLPTAQLPDGLKASLRDYQKEGVNWLCFLKDQGMGALLADDMGLGKTLQSITILSGKSLVICPTSVLYNWAAEIAKFRPNLKAVVYHGGDRELDATADVILTSYALLRLDLEKLKQTSWDTVILDEAQTIKNPESQAAQSAFALPAKFRIALSGTPVENKLEDMWSLFFFLNRGLLGTLNHFREHYAQPIKDGQADKQQLLKQRIKPFVLRRLKATVAKELPPRTDRNLYCELNEHERDLYQSILLASKNEVIEKLASGAKVFQILEVLLRLRQASCHPGLIPGQIAPAGSSKTKLLLKCLEKSVDNQHKSLVFSQWTGFLDLIEPAINQAGISYLRIDGGTKNRQEIVDEFQHSDQSQVLLLSLKAAGTGLNLTAAEHVIIADPWWNPAVEEQAADRAHRIGQERPVIVSRLIARNTVEEKILALKERKKDLANSVVSASGATEGLSRNDLLDLLSSESAF